MRVAPLIGLAWRVQRIAEEHQPGDSARPTLRRHVRGNPPAHRLAADESGPAADLRAGRVDRRAPRRLEHRRPIGHSAPRGDVRKIKRRRA